VLKLSLVLLEPDFNEKNVAGLADSEMYGLQSNIDFNFN
jgi:hypothetical protein